MPLLLLGYRIGLSEKKLRPKGPEKECLNENLGVILTIFFIMITCFALEENGLIYNHMELLIFYKNSWYPKIIHTARNFRLQLVKKGVDGLSYHVR